MLFDQLLSQDAFFLPGFLCDQEDQSVMERLCDELALEGKDLIDWHGARHLGLVLPCFTRVSACFLP